MKFKRNSLHTDNNVEETTPLSVVSDINTN